MKIREFLEEIFYDYHIRGCLVGDEKTNNICNTNKITDIKKILSDIHKVIVGKMNKRKDVYVAPCTARDFAKGYNQYRKEMLDKLKEMFE